MSLLEIPIGPALVFSLILIGYFALTVWFGKPSQSAVHKAPPVQPPQAPAKDERPRELVG